MKRIAEPLELLGARIPRVDAHAQETKFVGLGQVYVQIFYAWSLR